MAVRPACWPAGPRERQVLADLGGVQEGLVAEVAVLADEGLERAQPVGVSGLARFDFDVEVALEVGQVPLERGDVEGGGEAAQDLLHGEEACVIAEDLVHRVMRGGRLLDQVPGLALVVEGAPDRQSVASGKSGG